VSYIQSLRLTDFRSYPSLDLELDGSPVVFFGPNGAGKTNLLEAISFLSPGRGLRRAKLETVTRRYDEHTAPAWGVSAFLAGDDQPMKISVGQVPEHPRRRVVKIDDQSVSSTELGRHLTMMWLTPAQDRLFTGPASDRRKFLDRFSLIHTPDHGQHVLRYEKARTERNRLLSENISDPQWFDALETDMAKQGAHIAQARVETVTSLTAEIGQRPDNPFPKSHLVLEGDIEEKCQTGVGQDELEAFIKDQLAKQRPLDVRAGRSLWGVHKSDLRVTHTAKNMAAENCSTGEQKALLIGLFLAHARAQSNLKPYLLLDEVAAHLDEDRRSALIEDLVDLGTQLFMTGTDQNLFEAFGDRAQIFEISDGQASLT